jgi:Holliday junction resolvase RusA-like endonuclease
MSKILFECHIKVTRHFSQKNSKRIFNNRLVQDPKVAVHKNNLIRLLQIKKLQSRIETIASYINLECIFHYPKDVFYTKKGTINKKLIDLSNSLQGAEDSLTAAKIIEDDNLIFSYNGSTKVASLDNDYYLTIRITEYEIK